MKELKFRHEYKHLLNAADSAGVRARLAAVMRRDCHAGRGGGYRVRSLYFDNADDKALREKLDGINDREKFRIRFYDGDLSFIRLEKKLKKNGLGAKLSAPLTADECRALLAGEYEWMKLSGEALVVELYAKMRFQGLRPRTVVDYTREAFVYAPGNVRVTLDSGLRTGMGSIDFLDPALPTLPAASPGATILEVKFDSFLPELVADAVQLGTRRAAPFSKYAAARIYV